MDLAVLHAFHKEALSAGLVARLLKARAAQGARVGSKVLGNVGKEVASSAGKAQASGGLRRLALNAGADVRAAKGAKTLASKSGVGGQRAALKSRADQMTGAVRTAPQTVTAPFTSAAAGTTRGYSPGAANFMAGKGTLAQAQKQTLANPSVLTPRGALPISPGAVTAGTSAGTPLAKLRAQAPGGGTAAGTPLAKLRAQAVNPMGATQAGAPLSGPAMAYQKTMLARRAMR